MTFYQPRQRHEDSMHPAVPDPYRREDLPEPIPDHPKTEKLPQASPQTPAERRCQAPLHALVQTYWFLPLAAAIILVVFSLGLFLGLHIASVQLRH